MKSYFQKKFAGFVAFINNFFTPGAVGHETSYDHNISDHGPILELLLHLCDGDETKMKWVLRWIAYPLRNQGAKMDVALMVSGPHGTGKNLFFEHVVGNLYQQHASIIPAVAMRSVFNEWAVGAKMVIINGDDSLPPIPRLKALITSRELLIERKSKAPKLERNCLNFIFIGGQDAFATADLGSRRFFCIDAPDRASAALYNDVVKEINFGGIDDLRDYLINDLDMVGFDAHTPPPGVDVTRQPVRFTTNQAVA